MSEPQHVMSEPQNVLSETIADDRDRALDPRAVPAGRLSGLVGTVILGLLAAAGAVFLAFAAEVGRPGVVVLTGLWLILIGLLAARAWIWPAVSYRYVSYRVSPRGLVIRRGVLWRSVATVPRSRIQHTDVSQGPLQRPFGLSTLTIHTAGTHFAAVPLSGLAKETAEAIRDHLIDDRDRSVGDGV